MPITRKDNAELINAVALLVLDAQECFFDALPDKHRFLGRCAFAIDAAQVMGIQTLFTEQAPDKLGHADPKLLRRAHQPKVFPKTAFSALSAPGLQNHLRDQEIYHLLICGLETPICVYQTGLQSVDDDIDVTFLTDALGCRRPEDEPFVIDALRELGCQLLPSETVFYSLLRDVSHPQFRAFNRLVKSFSEKDFNVDAYLKGQPLTETIASDSPKSKPSKRTRNRRSRNRKAEPSSPEKPSEKKKSQPSSKKPAPSTRPSKKAKVTKNGPHPSDKKGGGAAKAPKPPRKRPPRKVTKSKKVPAQ